jgi:hypothetical protein
VFEITVRVTCVGCHLQRRRNHPETRPSIDSITARGIGWNYTTFLNIVFFGVAAALVGLTVRRGARDPVCGMTVDRSKTPYIPTAKPRGFRSRPLPINPACPSGKRCGGLHLRKDVEVDARFDLTVDALEAMARSGDKEVSPWQPGGTSSFFAGVTRGDFCPDLCPPEPRLPT